MMQYEMPTLIKPPKLNLGDTIGIPCLSHVAEPVQYKSIIDTITRLWFKVKLGEHAYSDTYGYAASAEERGADFNMLIADPDVKMIIFGGGKSSGILIGGYLSIFDRLQGHKNYHIDLSKKYILFLEDFERSVTV
jgi:muramoyltetrapeptide carboxypeptidase